MEDKTITALCSFKVPSPNISPIEFSLIPDISRVNKSLTSRYFDPNVSLIHFTLWVVLTNIRECLGFRPATRYRNSSLAVLEHTQSDTDL